VTHNLTGAVVALFVVSAVAAQGQEPAPCAALTPKIQPCAQPAAPPETAPPLATIDGTPVTLADLDESTRKSVAGLADAEAEARRKALREATDDLLIEKEAARRGITPGRLLETNVFAAVQQPTEADIAAEIAAHPEKYKSGGEISDRASANLFEARRRAKEKEFVAGLEKRHPLRDSELAARGALHVDVAAADTRIRVMKAQKSAVDQVVHDRLLRAEAARQGITPDELTQREVTAKVAPATDAELKEKWQKYKKILGDDFEKERDTIRTWVDSEKKDRAEKAFDDRLREGHVIRVLFEVPSRPPLKLPAGSPPSSGARDAKVTLVEFGDFQCPPCGYMSGVIDEVLPPYGDRVRYVFRQFPLRFHRFAWKAAEAGLAAHAQGKFFPYAHLLFANQDALDVASLKKYATSARLDRARFDKDLDSGRFASVVIEDERLGERAGVLGTPSFFLNGLPLGDDGYTAEGLRAAIDRELERH